MCEGALLPGKTSPAGGLVNSARALPAVPLTSALLAFYLHLFLPRQLPYKQVIQRRGVTSTDQITWLGLGSRHGDVAGDMGRLRESLGSHRELAAGHPD